MDPVTIALLTSMAGQAMSSSGQLIPSAQERANKARLEQLKRREREGQLGLTQKEEAAIRGRMTAAQRQQQEFGEAERQRYLAGGGAATGGQALQQAVAGEEQRMRAASDIAQTVLEQDLAEREREMDELRALEAAASEAQQARISAIGAIGATGLEAAMTEAKNQAVIQGQRDVSPAAVTGLAQTLGVSEEEARGMYELALENPEMLKYFAMLGAE
jgi:hypothetical protein